MRRLIMIALLVAGCGRHGEGWACDVDADCDKALRCATLQTPDGAKRAMCVNPDGVWDVSAEPKTNSRYIVPIGIAFGGLLLLVMLRASIVSREKRRKQKAKSDL